MDTPLVPYFIKGYSISFIFWADVIKKGLKNVKWNAHQNWQLQNSKFTILKNKNSSLMVYIGKI